MSFVKIQDLDRKILIQSLEHYSRSWDFWNVDTLSKTLEQKNSAGFVHYTEPLMSHKQISGLIFFSTSIDFADLLYLFVPKKFRRRGIAQQMLAKSFASLNRQGIERVFLEVKVSNLAARELYLSNGFEIIDRRSRYYKNGETAIIMEKNLG